MFPPRDAFAKHHRIHGGAVLTLGRGTTTVESSARIFQWPQSKKSGASRPSRNRERLTAPTFQPKMARLTRMKKMLCPPSVKSVLLSVKVSAGCANFLTAKNAQNAKKSTFHSELFEFFAFFAVIIFGCGVSRPRVIRGQKTAWRRLGELLCILRGKALTVFIFGAAAFQMRDIKS